MKASTIRASVDGNAVELWVLSEITSWVGQDFMGAVNAYGKDKSYILNINSPGGDPFTAFAIADYIKAAGIKVTTRIWGHAASAAAIIAASTDRVEMGELSHLMIHNAYGGNSPELLDSLNAKQVEVFAAKTGKRGKDIAAMMDAETWMDAKTAKREGFADAIISELAIAALYKAQYMEENKTVEVAEDAAPETVETTVETTETTTAETVTDTDTIEQEVEITANDLVQAALGRKKKVTFSVSSHFTSTINALAEEVKEKAVALTEAEGEIERLKEQLAAAEAAKSAAETQATEAQAEVEKVQAMFSTVKAELETVSAEPVTPATPSPVTDAPAVEPGKMSAEQRATTKQTKREAEMREAFGRFAPKPNNA